jgi:hypothetical protein
MSGSSSRTNGAIVAGTILVALGGLFLLDNYGILEAGDVFRYWPLILIGLGLTRLLSPGRRDEYVGGVVLLFLGSVFLLRALNLPWFRLHTVWPLLLVVLGVSLIFKALRSRTGDSGVPGESPGARALAGAREGLAATRELRGDPTEAGAILHEFALMGGGERIVRAQDFRGGEVTAIMGGFQIDLRSAGMAGDSAIIEVFTLFGGVEFRVPQDWDVVMTGTPILGMLSSTAWSSRDRLLPAKKLIIRGTAIMGGVEAKN